MLKKNKNNKLFQQPIILKRNLKINNYLITKNKINLFNDK